MSILFSRARRLFAYGDLNGSSESASITRRTASTASFGDDSSVVTLEPATEGDMNGASSSVWKRKRRRVVAAVVFFGLVAVVLISVSVKSEKHESAAAIGVENRLPKEFSTATKLGRSGKTFIGESAAGGGGESGGITLDDINGYKYQPITYFNGTWIDDDEFTYVNHETGLIVANVRNPMLNRRIMQVSPYNHFDSSDHWVSADKKFLMLQVKSERLFRRSTLSEYYIFSLEDGGKAASSTTKLRPSTTSSSHNDAFRIRLASFAPRGNGLAYVDHENNIYYRRSVMSPDEKLTDTGVDTEVYNGVADWVFEEEVFEDTRALWWAPDGQKIVWGVFNDSAVEKVILLEYGPWEQEVDQYPFPGEYAYPKAGTRNPGVQLWLADLRNDEIRKRQIAPPRSLVDRGEEVHFSWVTFVDNETFAVQWMNRVQNKTVVTLCRTEGLQDCQEMFHHEEPKGWIDYKYRLTFDPKWTPKVSPIPDFVTVLANPDQPHKYRQLVLVSNGTKTYLTNREADVASVLSWSKEGNIYYMSAAENRPVSRHMYKVAAAAKGSSFQESMCVTCNRTDMSEMHRRPCDYHEVTMSLEGSYFAMTCLGPDIPYTCVHETASDKLIEIYEDNKSAMDRLAEVELPEIRLIEVPISGPGSNGLKVQVKLYLPPNFIPTNKYPTLVWVYGGPGQQYADAKFDQSSYQTYLSGSKGFIYAIVDPIGSGQMGDDWLFAMNRGFGTVEVNSTIEAVKYMQEHLSFVDANRTAIWGWSYGGFLSLSVLGHDHGGVFRCGASVAPVVDWRLYDTYYTERYMSLPHDNPAGYNRSQVFWYLDNLRTKPFLLMHGTKDDNVHYQQSMLLSAALESKDILFRQHSYPDQDHQIQRYQRHLYHTLTDFLLNDCFAERKTRKKRQAA